MVGAAQLLSAAALTLGVSASGDPSVLSSEIGRLNNQSLFWGPYKPNLYFGVRPRVPQGLWSGLIWSNVDAFENVAEGFRYTCEQGEGMRGYGWDEYDARHGGIQTIHDTANKIDITTSFIKVPGGDKGGSWAVRIKGVPHEDAPKDLKTMLFYYVSQEGEGELEVTGESTDAGFEGDVTLKGRSDSLGEYSMTITKGEGEHPKQSAGYEYLKYRVGHTTVVKSTSVADEVAWQGQGVLFMELKECVNQHQEQIDVADPPPPWQIYRLPNKPGEGNTHIVQKTFEGAFEYDVIYSSASTGEKLTTADVTREIKRTSESFNERFASIFSLKTPFKDEKHLRFGKSMFANLLGGIGYFQGHQLIDRSYASEYDEEDEGFWTQAAEARARGKEQMEGPYELFTSIPSRPFFPRGFLWDEGFHLVPIADWDMDIALEIVESWFKTMDEDGWIPREQILGNEARSKVPKEFQVQYPHYANPPTLFLVIEGFMERLRKSNVSQSQMTEKLSQDPSLHTAHLDHPELGEQYLRRLYPLLRRQYDWFRRTQRGEIKAYDREAFSRKEAYRWRGRTETHILTSGLDDYPRPQPPSPGELHVDLMSWVGLMAKSLANIADALGMNEDATELSQHLNAIQRNLDDLHWSEKEGCYCDATIDDFEEHALVCHKGYISIFPFIVGIMKHDDPKVGKILDLIGDEDHLWSPFGIRSLSMQDPHYGTEENYWRSPVWMPINYLILVQLRHLAMRGGPHKQKALELYTPLRNNLVETVYYSWEATGFAWEQYNPDTGAGQRTQHFTGWTSLVVKIMAMEDLNPQAHLHDEL